jgi:hypothetical protein
MDEISTLGVLRLRATSSVSRDKSVRRSAQDDGFVWGLKYSWLDMQKNTKKPKKSQALMMTVLSGAEIQLVGYAENAKRSKKSQALRMTILWFSRKTSVTS